MEEEIYQQMSLWDYVYPKKVIDKPIRLIEFFAGIGAQHKALKQLTDQVESWKICEWAYNSYCSYNAIHIKDFKDYSKDLPKEELIEKVRGTSTNYNEPLTDKQLKAKSIEWLKNAYNNIVATHNLVNIMEVHGKDLQIEDTDKYEYIMTYSFPCQDLSLAGKRQGMSVSQAEGGTRSGLLWEVERILSELDKKDLPQLLLMENVPEVIGTANIQDFQKWEQRLENLGYKNYIEILNAKDYGIPQNRRRCFMVSILGEYAYSFPIKMKLEHKLKDLLEKNVDEKYYLSGKMIKYITADNEKWTGNNDKALVNRNVACTLNTAPGQRRCDASNYVAPELEGGDIDLKKIGGFFNNKRLQETIDNNELHDNDFIDAYNRKVSSDVAGTITTRVSESNCTFIGERTFKKEMCDKLIKDGKVKENNMSPTLDTRCDCLGVVVSDDKSNWGGS